MNPAMTPYHSISAKAVVTIASELFNARLHRGELGSMRAPDGQPLTDQEIMNFQLENERNAHFFGGYLKHQSGSRVTTLSSLAFGQQNIAASVAGTTDEAMLVASEFARLLWEAAGYAQHWADLKDGIERISFSTTAVVDFEEGAIDRIFSERFKAFLDEDIASSNGLGASMGALGQDKRLSTDDYLLIPSLNILELTLMIVDRISGQGERAEVRITPHTKTSHNRCDSLVTSELPYLEHIELIEKLQNRLTE